LVEPARALADAERIAGTLNGGTPLRIEFVDPEERIFRERLIQAAPGDRSIPDKLDELLCRIAQLPLDPQN
jgi:hypothetical protein